jgi:hypothetical protein
MFTLTALTVDLSGVAHSTPGLDAWEGTTLGRFVTNTYAVLLQDEGEEVFEEDRGGEGEELRETPCIYCKLILIFGPSQQYNASKDAYRITDAAIEAAHQAAAVYFDAHKEDCVRVLHAGWRTNNPSAGRAHRYPSKKGGWEGTGRDSSIESWVNAGDAKGNPIDCFSHVLVIYHGETQQTTVNVLNWLARYCQAPIRHLYLWSCWGSEKIDPTAANVKRALKRVAGLQEARAQMRCDCQLCLYTSASLNVADAKRRLDEAIERMQKDTTTPKEQLQQAQKAQAKLAKSKQEQYAVPLGIKPIMPGDTNMVLLAPVRRMLVYCPLDLDTAAPTEKSIDDIEFFPDVPVEQDKDLLVRSLLR